MCPGRRCHETRTAKPSSGVFVAALSKSMSVPLRVALSASRTVNGPRNSSDVTGSPSARVHDRVDDRRAEVHAGAGRDADRHHAGGLRRDAGADRVVRAREPLSSSEPSSCPRGRRRPWSTSPIRPASVPLPVPSPTSSAAQLTVCTPVAADAAGAPPSTPPMTQSATASRRAVRIDPVRASIVTFPLEALPRNGLAPLDVGTVRRRYQSSAVHTKITARSQPVHEFALIAGKLQPHDERTREQR